MITGFLIQSLKHVIDGSVLAVVSDSQRAGPQWSKQSVTMGFV